MATDTKLQELVINTMTKAQYDALETKDPNGVYAVTDAKIGAQDLDTSNVGTTGQVLSKTDSGMEWADVQGGGSGLPEQTGHTGFLQTDGTNATWSDSTPLVNSATTMSSLAIAGNNDTASAGRYATALGSGSKASGTESTAVGGATAAGAQSVAIGVASVAGSALRSIAIGYDAVVGFKSGSAAPKNAIQLGTGTNYDANTFQVFDKKMLTADGIIPPERLAAAPTEEGTYTLKATVAADGTVTMAWVKDA